jgi:hypothetical protein
MDNAGSIIEKGNVLSKTPVGPSQSSHHQLHDYQYTLQAQIAR